MSEREHDMPLLWLRENEKRADRLSLHILSRLGLVSTKRSLFMQPMGVTGLVTLA